MKVFTICLTSIIITLIGSYTIINITQAQQKIGWENTKLGWEQTKIGWEQTKIEWAKK